MYSTFFPKCGIENISLTSEIMVFFLLNGDSVILMKATALFCQHRRPWFSYGKGQLGQKAFLEGIQVPLLEKNPKLND